LETDSGAGFPDKKIGIISLISLSEFKVERIIEGFSKNN
jgi:hypothetical protein